uniref:Uncharacterized protein n=1 Tax=Oryza meridionalis TaxID=40149 RepID=A0A0E0DQG4_9ORYZ
MRAREEIGGTRKRRREHGLASVNLNCEEKKTKTNAPCTYLQGKREKRDMEDGEQGSLGLTCGWEEWGCGSTAASTTSGLCRRLAHSQGSLDGGGSIGIGIGGEGSDDGGIEGGGGAVAESVRGQGEAAGCGASQR